jgi:acyl-coenzyme A thioesterase PaaI-like protein
MGCAVHSTLDKGVGYTTVDLQVSFVRPLTTRTGPVRCEGTIVHVGSRIAGEDHGRSRRLDH